MKTVSKRDFARLRAALKAIRDAREVVRDIATEMHSHSVAQLVCEASSEMAATADNLCFAIAEHEVDGVRS